MGLRQGWRLHLHCGLPLGFPCLHLLLLQFPPAPWAGVRPRDQCPQRRWVVGRVGASRVATAVRAALPRRCAAATAVAWIRHVSTARIVAMSRAALTVAYRRHAASMLPRREAVSSHACWRPGKERVHRGYVVLLIQWASSCARTSAACSWDRSRARSTSLRRIS